MEKVSFFALLFVALIATINANPDTTNPAEEHESCKVFKGIKLDEECVKFLGGKVDKLKLATTANPEEIDSAVGAICKATKCVLSAKLVPIPSLDLVTGLLSPVLGILKGLLGGLNADGVTSALTLAQDKCDDLPPCVPATKGCPLKVADLGIKLAPEILGHVNNSLNIYCAAIQCLKDNGVTVNLTGTGHGSGCGPESGSGSRGKCPCILDVVPVLGSTLCSVLFCLLNSLLGIISGGGLGGTLGGLTGSLGGLTGTLSGLTGSLGGLTGNLEGTLSGLTGSLGGLTGNLQGTLSGLTQSIQGIVSGLLPSLQKLLGSVTGSLGGLTGGLTGGLGGLTGGVGGLTGGLGGLTGGLGGLTGGLGGLTGGVGGLTGGLGGLTGILGGVGGR